MDMNILQGLMDTEYLMFTQITNYIFQVQAHYIISYFVNDFGQIMTSKYPVGSQDMFLGLVGQFREIKIKINKNPKKVCPEHGGPLSALRAGWTSPVTDDEKKKKTPCKNTRKAVGLQSTQDYIYFLWEMNRFSPFLFFSF